MQIDAAWLQTPNHLDSGDRAFLSIRRDDENESANNTILSKADGDDQQPDDDGYAEWYT